MDGSGCYGVYAVENGEIEYRGCEEKNIYLGENRITDPACVRIENSGDPILSGFFWNETDYYIDESGFWQTDNKIYYYHDTGREIKTLVELKMPLVEPYTGEITFEKRDGRWLITNISHPYYDEFYVKWQEFQQESEQ